MLGFNQYGLCSFGIDVSSDPTKFQDDFLEIHRGPINRSGTSEVKFGSKKCNLTAVLDRDPVIIPFPVKIGPFLDSRSR